jgi:hypothetical protein
MFIPKSSLLPLILTPILYRTTVAIDRLKIFYSLIFSIKDLSIPYHLNSYLCLSPHQDHSTWRSQRIRHLSAEYAGHTPILHCSVTYLQINQLVEFPADSALSIRIGRPSHTLARMYQLSYSFRYFAPIPHPPFNPKYTKFKNVVRPCATSTDLLKAAQLLFVTIYMTTLTKKKRKNKIMATQLSKVSFTT